MNTNPDEYTAQEALRDLREVADEIGSRGLIDLSDDIRIALSALEPKLKAGKPKAREDAS